MGSIVCAMGFGHNLAIKGFCAHYLQVRKWRLTGFQSQLIWSLITMAGKQLHSPLNPLTSLYLPQYAMDKPLVSHFVKIQSHPRIVGGTMLSSWHVSGKIWHSLSVQEGGIR